MDILILKHPDFPSVQRDSILRPFYWDTPAGSYKLVRNRWFIITSLRDEINLLQKGLGGISHPFTAYLLLLFDLFHPIAKKL